MRNTTTLVSVLLAIALPLGANDSPTATRFLRDYVGALRLTRTGDALSAAGSCNGARDQYAQARNRITPYAMKRDFAAAATFFRTALDARAALCNGAIATASDNAGPLEKSAASASWSLIHPDSLEVMWVGDRDRRNAIRDLEETFGPLTSGPQSGQTDLQTAASALARILAHPPQPAVFHGDGVAAQR